MTKEQKSIQLQGLSCPKITIDIRPSDWIHVMVNDGKDIKLFVTKHLQVTHRDGCMTEFTK